MTGMTGGVSVVGAGGGTRDVVSTLATGGGGDGRGWSGVTVGDGIGETGVVSGTEGGTALGVVAVFAVSAERVEAGTPPA